MKEKSGSKNARETSNTKAAQDHTNGQQPSAEELYNTAVKLTEQSQAEEALQVAERLWSLVKKRSPTEALPALNLLGEISACWAS